MTASSPLPIMPKGKAVNFKCANLDPAILNDLIGAIKRHGRPDPDGGDSGDRTLSTSDLEAHCPRIVAWFRNKETAMIMSQASGIDFKASDHPEMSITAYRFAEGNGCDFRNDRQAHTCFLFAATPHSGGALAWKDGGGARSNEQKAEAGECVIGDFSKTEYCFDPFTGGYQVIVAMRFLAKGADEDLGEGGAS